MYLQMEPSQNELIRLIWACVHVLPQFGDEASVGVISTVLSTCADLDPGFTTFSRFNFFAHFPLFRRCRVDITYHLHLAYSSRNPMI